MEKVPKPTFTLMKQNMQGKGKHACVTKLGEEN